ncbi:Response regulator rcp1 [compost metagenome]
MEDNPDDVELTIRAFKKSDLAGQVIIANDGGEALDYLFGTGPYEGRDLNQMPQIILLDLKLKKMDGLEVLKRVRADQRTKLLPVIVLTSSQEEQDLIASYSLGANSYLRKPIDFNDFLEAVRQLGLYWLVFNVQPPSPEG